MNKLDELKQNLSAINKTSNIETTTDKKKTEILNDIRIIIKKLKYKHYKLLIQAWFVFGENQNRPNRRFLKSPSFIII